MSRILLLSVLSILASACGSHAATAALTTAAVVATNPEMLKPSSKEATNEEGAAPTKVEGKANEHVPERALSRDSFLSGSSENKESRVKVDGRPKSDLD